MSHGCQHGLPELKVFVGLNTNWLANGFGCNVLNFAYLKDSISRRECMNMKIWNFDQIIKIRPYFHLECNHFHLDENLHHNGRLGSYICLSWFGQFNYFHQFWSKWIENLSALVYYHEPFMVCVDNGPFGCWKWGS